MLKTLLTLVLGLLLSGCHSAPTSSLPALKIGIVTGPQEIILEKAKKIAKQQHQFTIEIVTFSNYMLPNMALAQGEVDANLFQTLSFFNESIEKQNLDLAILTHTFIYPMRLFSDKLQHVNQIPLHAKVAIPNDPTNEERALRLLESAGLLKLKVITTRLLTPEDVIENPHQLQIQTLDAAELPRVRPDFDLIALNNDFIKIAGLSEHAALFTEPKERGAPYANLIAVRKMDANPLFKKLIEIFESPEIGQITQKVSPGAIPAW